MLVGNGVFGKGLYIIRLELWPWWSCFVFYSGAAFMMIAINIIIINHCRNQELLPLCKMDLFEGISIYQLASARAWSTRRSFGREALNCINSKAYR